MEGLGYLTSCVICLKNRFTKYAAIWVLESQINYEALTVSHHLEQGISNEPARSI